MRLYHIIRLNLQVWENWKFCTAKIFQPSAHSGNGYLALVGAEQETKKIVDSTSNVLPLHLKQTFPPTIWIFTEGDGIKSSLPFKIFSTLTFLSFWNLTSRKIDFLHSSFAKLIKTFLCLEKVCLSLKAFVYFQRHLFIF